MPIYSIFLLWTTKWSHVLLVTTDKHEKSKKSKLNYQGGGFFYTTLTLCWHLGAYQVVSIQKKNLFLTNKGGGVDSPERLLLLPDQFFCLNFLEYAVMSSNINIIFSDWLTFDGIHPTFKQVPPNDFSFSTQTVCKTKELKPCKHFAFKLPKIHQLICNIFLVIFKTVHVFVQTFIPSWAALMDATYPPGPDPITTRSTSPKQGNKISFKIYHLLGLIYLCITYSTSWNWA